ncbi:MAG: hypothetical protein M3Z04_02315 [Chloroflexota bacterium]|nr:hypothetical protein [Chloroflexota bacterium]
MTDHANDSHYPADAAGDHAPAHDDAHAAEHGVDGGQPPTGSSEPSTPLSAFIWPGLIALLTLILVAGPISRAFEQFHGGSDANGQLVQIVLTPTVVGTLTPGLLLTQGAITPAAPNSSTVIPMATDSSGAVPTTLNNSEAPTVAATQTAVPVTGTAYPATDTAVPAPDTAVPATDTVIPATDTAVPAMDTAVPPPAPASATPGASRLPTDEEVRNGAPRTVTVGGQPFRVEVSNTTLPDWQFSPDPSVANWLTGTVVNYVLGVAYSPANATLFSGVHPSDAIQLTRADGTVYHFVVDQAGRIDRTDTHLLQQDHPAVTLLLLGDPANDRVVVQAHFQEPTGQ